MRKSINQGGDNIFILKGNMNVTKGIFAKAMADHHWEKSEEFDPLMKKSDALRLLKQRLFHHGISGMYTEHWDGASEEFLGVFNRAYEAALQWIDRNYPYLSK